MWIQTLPSTAQANILGFLEIEHRMFHAKDLEHLALELISDPQLDFWVLRASEDLLKRVGCSIVDNQEVERRRETALPGWLSNHKSQYCLLPWMHLSQSSPSNEANPTREGMDLSLDTTRQSHVVDATTFEAPTNEDICDGHHDTKGEKDVPKAVTEGYVISDLQTPPHDEGCRQTSEELRVSTEVQTDLDEGKNLVISLEKKGPNHINEYCSGSTSRRLEDQDTSPSLCQQLEEEDNFVFELAQSLRDSWVEKPPTFDELQKISSLPDSHKFFRFLKPWEMKDDSLLDMMKVFLGKESGFAWCAQIFSYCLLPKLILLEQPASSFLISAIMEASKIHARATIDTLLIPLVLHEKGLNKVQCDVINRLLKDSLSDNHISSFCGKIFLGNRRQQLPFPDPPFMRRNYLSAAVIWSEPAWTMLQNILGHHIDLDRDLLEVLVYECCEAGVKFTKSLKYCNLLLCLVSKFGSLLQPYKSRLQRVAEQTETFITRALLNKTSAL
ncbi:hypothetical protein KP509_1Z067700 [Ceratopteris richardii]|nr:hypothetical protein KP509_1Z067700 [Ceratopteris richardii]